MNTSASRQLLLYALLASSAAAAVWTNRLGWEHRPYSPALTSAATIAPLYENHALGVSFRYPAGHIVEAYDRSTPNRIHWQLLVAPDTEEYRALKEGKLPGREWPNMVTLDIYDNRFEAAPLQEWIRGNAESNWKLGDGTLATTTLGGHAAFRYQFDGLYLSEAVAASANGLIYLLAFGVLGEDDPIRLVANQVEWTLDITAPLQ